MKIDPNNPGRVFLFIDETGDPGYPDHHASSDYYLLNIAVADRAGVRDIGKHFSRFRYFQDAGKELKRYDRSQNILCDLFKVCDQKEYISFYSFYIEKDSYIGPYLKFGDSKKYDYDPNKFRNFVIRKSLETLFGEILPMNYHRLFQSGLEFEIVLDRFLIDEKDEQHLKKYLRGNYNLPHLLHIVQVDSEYSDLVQTADFLGRLVKKSVFDGKEGHELDFVNLFCLENPNKIDKRKGPRHS